MRTLTLGSVKIKTIDIQVADQLISFLDNTPERKDQPQQGQSSACMRKRHKVVTALEACRVPDPEATSAEGEETTKEKYPDSVDLSDDNWRTLKSCIENVSYPFGDKGFIEVEDRVLNAKEVKSPTASTGPTIKAD